MSQVVKVKAGGYHLRYQNPGSKQTDLEAERDVKEYLTSKQWDYVIGEIRAGVMFQRIYFMFDLAGVRGYPARAMLRLHHPRFLRRFEEMR